MGRHFHFDDLTIVGLAGDQPFGKAGAGQARHSAHWPQDSDQRRQVVGSHVEHRSAAGLVVEGGVGVPVFMAARHHKGRRRHRLADDTIIDDFATGLQAAAQEGIGRTADAHAFCRRCF